MSASTIVRSLSRSFPPDLRARGEDYLRRKRVMDLQGDSTGIDAVVRGSRLYAVSLEVGDGTLYSECDCPYFQQNVAPCKHLWALILAADKQGLLDIVPGITGIEPVEPDHLEDDLLDEDEPIFAEDDAFGLFDPEDEWTAPRDNLPVRRHPAPARGGNGLWKDAIEAVRALRHIKTPPQGFEAGRREILYLLDLDRVAEAGDLILGIQRRDRTLTGGWSKPRSLRLDRCEVESLPDVVDRRVLGLLGLFGQASIYAPWSARRTEVEARIPPALADSVFREACPTGRLLIRRSGQDEAVPLHYEEGDPWRFRIRVKRDGKTERFVVTGLLARGDETVPLSRPDLLLAAGFVFEGDRVRRFSASGAFPLVVILRRRGRIEVPAAQAVRFMSEVLPLDEGLVASAPRALRFKEVRAAPEPAVRILKPKHSRRPLRLPARVTFTYDGLPIEAGSPGTSVAVPAKRRLIRRDGAAESTALELLSSLGFHPPRTGAEGDGGELELAARKLPSVVPRLLEAGWRVEAAGNLYRSASDFRIEVVSGVDWFDLRGGAIYDGVEVPLPELLAALRKGEKVVRLGDGNVGLLPEEWLRRYVSIAGLGQGRKDGIRFSRAQAGFLDALLAAEPEVTCDALFEQVRGKLRAFEGVRPAEATAEFRGVLRPYQRDGLGWLRFLREFGFGGCLADDMGLGKTIQVLALLEALREEARAGGSGRRRSRSRGPCLVVAPRSLVLNWMAEAARFAPRLRLLDHTGLERRRDGFDPSGQDVILTTYGTLVRDISLLKEVAFDTVILDEAQAIKNARTQAAKAARLLRAEHRLALSGTPIENHLGELWSLFEFLNPGMLGSSPAFELGARATRDADGPARALLARALRPFILRRTKAQVTPDLPAKTEQTLPCELGAAQQRFYGELRDHYRRVLLARVRKQGLARSKIQILEALLRLRQAACHPGLVDPGRAREASAKLDLLVPLLQEVADERHKALVFSQFTSLLALVKERLDAEDLRYCYLDGSMSARNRAEAVRRFQEDPACPLFLLSLKAGGYGLNLTAAEYVYLLDPWWNPAVETQAIDRTHRIGQTRPVFAYRIVAAETIEEKILDLHASKRELADSILAADGSVIRNLTREDLALLLS